MLRHLRRGGLDSVAPKGAHGARSNREHRVRTIRSIRGRARAGPRLRPIFGCKHDCQNPDGLWRIGGILAAVFHVGGVGGPVAAEPKVRFRNTRLASTAASDPKRLFSYVRIATVELLIL
jgi:hypothetical protein